MIRRQKCCPFEISFVDNRPSTMLTYENRKTLTSVVTYETKFIDSKSSLNSI